MSFLSPPKPPKIPDPASPATTAEAGYSGSMGSASPTLIGSLPAYTTSGLTTTARSGRKSLLGSA